MSRADQSPQATPKCLYFDGEGDFEMFWTKFSRFVKIYNINDTETMVWHLTECLEKKAAIFLEEVVRTGGMMNLHKIGEAFRRRFGDTELPAVRLMKFSQARRGPDESFKDFEARVWKLGRKAFPTLDDQTCELQVMNQFIQGIGNQELASFLTLRNSRTMEEAIQGLMLYQLDKSRRFLENHDREDRNPNRYHGQQDMARSYVENPMTEASVRAVSQARAHQTTAVQSLLEIQGGQELRAGEGGTNDVRYLAEQINDIKAQNKTMMKMLEAQGRMMENMMGQINFLTGQVEALHREKQNQQKAPSDCPSRIDMQVSHSKAGVASNSPGGGDRACHNCGEMGHWEKDCKMPRIYSRSPSRERRQRQVQINSPNEHGSR